MVSSPSDDVSRNGVVNKEREAGTVRVIFFLHKIELGYHVFKIFLSDEIISEKLQRFIRLYDRVFYYIS